TIVRYISNQFSMRPPCPDCVPVRFTEGSRNCFTPRSTLQRMLAMNVFGGCGTIGRSDPKERPPAASRREVISTRETSALTSAGTRNSTSIDWTAWRTSRVIVASLSNRFLPLSRKRCCISRQVDNVFVGEFCDDTFHQRGVGARVGARLEIVKLSHQIDRVDIGQTRNVAQPLQTLSVADGAFDGLTIAASLGEGLAFSHASNRHQRVEARARTGVAQSRSLDVHRQHDNAIADWLSRFVVGINKSHAALTEIGLRHGVLLDHLDPGRRRRFE